MTTNTAHTLSPEAMAAKNKLVDRGYAVRQDREGQWGWWIIAPHGQGRYYATPRRFEEGLVNTVNGR